jgi:Neprosin
MKALKQHVLVSVIVLLVVTCSATLNAQSFVPFNQFLANTTSASAASYVGQPGFAVQDDNTFSLMQQYILTMYQAAQVSQSFYIYGQYYDCIPIQEQPSYVLQGLNGVAQAPPATTAMSAGDVFSPQLGPGDQYDQFGNSTTCGVNTIPMRRLTLNELASYATLSDFQSKAPDGSGQLPGEPAPQANHQYAYTLQTVNNFGGSSALNLWSPFVNQLRGQIFSLSQQWYSAGNGNTLQTVEGGWQNYPAKYGDQNSRLFIFWTANNYGQNGTVPIIGCYNLDCPGFMQTSRNWHLGGKFSNYSTSGGTQYYFTMTWYFYQGNWWLALGNDNSREWVGYYPGQVFRNGAMTQMATSIRYGGETAQFVGFNVWGPMGSGAFANQGYGLAAYQRQIYFVNTTNATQWANLAAVQPAPACYTDNGPWFVNNTTWGEYFFFGGPGGNNC